MSILKYLRSRANTKAGHNVMRVRMNTSRGTQAIENLVRNYVGRLRSAKTPADKKEVERNFMHKYMEIKSNENAQLKEVVELMAHGVSPLKRSVSATTRERVPSTPSGRPPRPSPRFTAARNKLVANIRAEIKKLTNARNYYAREANKMQSKLNALTASRQRQ